MIVHCLHLFIKFSEAVFFPNLLDKIHTNEIQAQSVNNNEKVNSFCREASACKTSSGKMVIFFFAQITKQLQSFRINIWLLGSIMVCVTSSYPLANKKNDVVLKYKTETRYDSSMEKTNTVKQHVMGLA